MRMLLATMSLALAVGRAFAADPAQIIVHSVKPGGSFGEIMVEIRNNSSKTLQKVYFNCGVFGPGGEMIGADDGYSENIPAGESDYKRELANITKGAMQDVSSAKCRITSVR